MKKGKEPYWISLFYDKWIGKKDNIKYGEEIHKLAKEYFHSGYMRGRKGD